MGQSLEERFWAKVDKGEPDECWEWQAATSHGYGNISTDEEKGARAHRVAMKLEGHDIKGQYVLHHCDNKLCVNPRHLYLGDQQDNMDDAVERNKIGSNLTEADARKIRQKYSEGLTQKAIAEEYGVTQPTISRIVNK